MYQDKTLRALSIKAYENALELISDANILYEAHSFSRAYVLAHLATEEIAKLPIIFGVRVRMKNKENIDWKQFNKRLNGHQSKLKSIAFFDYMNQEVDLIHNSDFEHYKKQLDHVKNFDLLKNMGLYSGIHENSVFKPSEQFDDKICHSMIQLTTGRLRCLELRWPEMIGADIPEQDDDFHQIISDVLNFAERQLTKN